LIQTYVLILGKDFNTLGFNLKILYETLPDANEMIDIFEIPLEIKDNKNAKNIEIKKGEIEFKNVNFSYLNDENIINDLNFKIKPKEKVAFVGHSGAGKSTIFKLILRAHDISSGQIFFDKNEIKDFKLNSLMDNISYVPQDPLLFHRSINENIGLGKFSEMKVEEASKLANSDSFVKKFKNKYETLVGERGVKLSGGEKQRIAIARAILKDSPILLLDEATSALDSETEKLIQEALFNLMKDKTVLVIAHRLSTIIKMDRILVMDQGKIVEEGSHDELLKNKNGIYYKMWFIQKDGFVV
jgi:ATP-binding cassette subfamily B protein